VGAVQQSGTVGNEGNEGWSMSKEAVVSAVKHLAKQRGVDISDQHQLSEAMLQSGRKMSDDLFSAVCILIAEVNKFTDKIHNSEILDSGSGFFDIDCDKAIALVLGIDEREVEAYYTFFHDRLFGLLSTEDVRDAILLMMSEDILSKQN
jgi:hypothetical protein